MNNFNLKKFITEGRLLKEEYADNMIEFNGRNVDLDTAEFEYDEDGHDRTGVALMAISYADIDEEELGDEELQAFEEMYSDNLPYWVYDYGTATPKGY